MADALLRADRPHNVRLRVGTVIAIRVEDHYPNGKRWWVRLHEKGGKRHEIPAHHEIEAFLDEYFAAAGLDAAESNRLSPRWKSSASTAADSDDVACLKRPAGDRALAGPARLINLVVGFGRVQRRLSRASQL